MALLASPFIGIVRVVVPKVRSLLNKEEVHLGGGGKHL